MFKKMVCMTALTSMFLTGCASQPPVEHIPVKQIEKIEDSLPEENKSINNIAQKNPVVVLPIAPDVLVPLPIQSDEASLPLSNTRISNFSTSRNADIEVVLAQLLNGSGFGYVFIGDKPDKKINISYVSGTIPELIRMACRSAGVHCLVKDGVVEVSQRAKYIVRLPRTDDKDGEMIGKAIQATIKIDGKSEGDVVVDEAGGNIIFSATVEEVEAVSRYLNQLRENRASIELSIWVSEVSLTSKNSFGINWESLSGKVGNVALDFAGGSTFETQTGGLGIVFDSNKFSMDGMLKFLGNQGAVRNLLNNKTSVLTGKTTEFESIETISYVKEVGQNVSTIGNNTGTGTGTDGSGSGTGGQVINNSNISNTVQTEELEVGTKVNVWSDYVNGQVVSKIDLDISDFLGFQSIPTGGTTIQLPRTSARKLKTQVSVRPGDIIILAGTKAARTQKSLLGIPGSGSVLLPTEKNSDDERKELVILLKPTVVKYVPVDENGYPIKNGHKNIDAKISVKGNTEIKTIPANNEYVNIPKPAYVTPYNPTDTVPPVEPLVKDVPLQINQNTEPFKEQKPAEKTKEHELKTENKTEPVVNSVSDIKPTTNEKAVDVKKEPKIENSPKQKAEIKIDGKNSNASPVESAPSKKIDMEKLNGLQNSNSDNNFNSFFGKQDVPVLDIQTKNDNM